MMKLRRIFLSIFVINFLIISSIGCISYEEVEITDIQSVKVLKLSTKGISVESTIKLLNKNSYDIKVVDSDFEVFVKDVKVGNAHLEDAINVESNSEKYYTLQLKSDFKDMSKGAVPKLIAITAMGGNDIPVKIDGYVEGKVFLFKKKYHFVKEENVPLDLFEGI